MKLYISYFNNIRNMTYHFIPVSTAKWDPKWYRCLYTLCSIDKRGVSNGLRCESLVFDDFYWQLLEFKNEQCIRNCKQTPGKCGFMQLYAKQLKETNVENVLSTLQTYQKTIAKLWNEPEENFKIVLMVHEKPDVLCAERPVLQQYFKNNGIELIELTKEIIENEG